MPSSGIYERPGLQQDLADFDEFKSLLWSMTRVGEDESVRAFDRSDEFARNQEPYKFSGRAVVSFPVVASSMDEAANEMLAMLLAKATTCVKRLDKLSLGNKLALSTIYKAAQSKID